MSKYDIDLSLSDRNSLSVLISRIKPNSVILEFGPANGRMTKYMKEQLNCKVYAVEIDANAAKDAEQYTEKIIVDSIENYSWQQEFKNIKFDCIIFADVLEHLYYPEKVLASVKDFVQDDGSILISIPNIAHNSIIIDLLNDEFNYHPTGLLDDTHIRFFTKKTFDALIQRCGLYTIYETAIFVNPEHTEFSNSYDDLPMEMSRMLKEAPFGEAYQFIYELHTDSRIEPISNFSKEIKRTSKYFAQLFLDHGNGISEENSIRIPVAQDADVQEFVFDLSGKPVVTALRFDPLNDSCVLEIEKCTLITISGEIDLNNQMTSNALIHYANSYFFDHNDPQILFAGLAEQQLMEAKKLAVRIRYRHVSNDALRVSIHQIMQDNNTIIEQKEQKLNQIHIELDQAKIEIEQTKAELAQSRTECCYVISERDQVSTELNLVKTELADVLSSKSWRLTKPLRAISRLYFKTKQ